MKKKVGTHTPKKAPGARKTAPRSRKKPFFAVIHKINEEGDRTGEIHAVPTKAEPAFTMFGEAFVTHNRFGMDGKPMPGRFVVAHKRLGARVGWAEGSTRAQAIQVAKAILRGEGRAEILKRLRLTEKYQRRNKLVREVPGAKRPVAAKRRRAPNA